MNLVPTLERTILEFLQERELLRIPQTELYDEAKYLTEKREIKVSPFVQPIGLFDPVTRTLPQVFDGDGLRVKQKGMLLAEQQTVALNNIIPVPAGEIWQIEAISGYMEASVAVAARDMGIDINYSQPDNAVLPNMVDIAVVVVNATQAGAITLGNNLIHWTWSTAAGYAAVADENPLFMPFPGGSTVALWSTNADVADVYSLLVAYRRVD